MTDISALLNSGLLKVGTRLVWKRRGGEHFSAEIIEGGRIKTSDGSLHKSPSGAARSLIGRPVDGWIVWQTTDGQQLSDYRSRLSKGDQ